MAGKGQLFKGFYNWTFLLIVIVAVVLVNIISSFVYQRYDMTEDQRFSLSPGTITYLENEKNFENRLFLKIYLEGKLPAELSHFRSAIEDKLKEFKQYAGDRIEYQFIDPNEGTEKERDELQQSLWAEGRGILPMEVTYTKDGSQSKLLLWPGAVIEYEGATVNTIQFLPGSKPNAPYQLNRMGELIQNAVNNLEYMLISSLRRATQEKKPRIAFLHGHGELEFKNTQRARALLSPYFAIADVTINDSIAALDNVDGLIIARPTQEFSQSDMFLIDQFVMRGGRLMCFMDKLTFNEDTLDRTGQTHTSRLNLGIDKMLFNYGLKIQDNYVIDARCGIKQVPLREAPAVPWFFHVIATPTNHPIARNLEPVSLEYTNEIQFIQNNPNVALTPVLTSSTNSTTTGLAPLINLAMPLNYGKNPELVANPESENNKKCLAGLAEGRFKSYFKNRVSPEYIEQISKLDKSRKVLDSSSQEGKVLLIGNGRFLSNDYDSVPRRNGTFAYMPSKFNNLQYNRDMINLRVNHIFGNQEFIQNIADYMLGETSVLDLRSRQIDVHEIDNAKVKQSASFYKIINVGLPILLIVAMAFIVYFLRKRKYAA